MNIDNLKIILKVSEYSSINKASLAVYRTQSQVSRIVRDFEALVHVKIFERSTKGVQVTKEGEQLLLYCKQIVSLYDEMLTFNEPEQAQKYSGILNVYASINIYSTLSEILSAFSTKYPQISINNKTLTNEAVIQAVAENTPSFGAFPQIYHENKTTFFPIPDKLEYQELFSIPVVAMCNTNSDFAKKHKSLSPQTLLHLPLIQYNPTQQDLSFTEILLHLMGIPAPSFHYTTDDYRVLIKLISKGSGIYVGICPSIKSLPEDTAILPIRTKIKVGFGSLTKKNDTNELTQLFQQFFTEWYTKIY